MKGLLSEKDFTSILINVLYVKLLLGYPRQIVLTAGNASWILSIYVTLVMLLIVKVLSYLHDFSVPLLEKCEEAYKKRLRIPVGIILTATAILSMSLVVRTYPETVKIILLQRTPTDIIIFIFAAATLIGAYMGIEALGRITSLFLPVAFAVLTFCFLFLIPHMNVYNIFPVFGKGIKSITGSGLIILSAFSDITVIYALSVKGDRKKALKSINKAVIVTGAIMTVILMTYGLCFPEDIAENYLMPVYQLTRIIQIGDFFGRFEAFFEFVWSVSVLLYLSSYLYAIAIIWKDTFNIKYYKPLLLPLLIIILFFSIGDESSVEFNKNFNVYSFSLILLTVLLPLIPGLICKNKNRRSKG